MQKNKHIKAKYNMIMEDTKIKAKIWQSLKALKKQIQSYRH